MFSSKFLLVVFLTFGVLAFHCLANQDELEVFGKRRHNGMRESTSKHKSLSPRKDEKPLSRNKNPAPLQREKPPEKDHKHPAQGDRALKGPPKPPFEHIPQPLPVKKVPSSNHKRHATAEKPSMRDNLPHKHLPATPAGDSQNHLNHTSPKNGMKDGKKPSQTKLPTPGKKPSQTKLPAPGKKQSQTKLPAPGKKPQCILKKLS